MSSDSPPVLVSACLLGEVCRYNAVRRHNSRVIDSSEPRLPVCPEVWGGLPTPRPAADIVGGDGADVLDGKARVIDETGRDVTEAFLSGAQKVLETAQSTGARKALLKSRSPSCGCGELSRADGSRTAGNGVTAALLLRHGIEVESTEFDQAKPDDSSAPDCSPLG